MTEIERPREVPGQSADTSAGSDGLGTRSDPVEGTSPAAWGAPDGPPADGGRDAGASGGDGFVNDLSRTLTGFSNDIRAAARNVEWPFDSFSSALEWWYRPVVEARTWIAIGSLFVGAIWGPVMFVIALVAVAVTFSLTVVGIGLLLVVPTFALLNGLTAVERRRAGWTGEPIPPATLAASGHGPLAAITTRLTDGARWRQALFIGLFLVGGPVLFALGVLPWALVVDSVFDRSVDGVFFAALLAGAAPRVTILVARLGRAFTAGLLGPSDTAELQERVTELSGQRQQILDAVASERRRIERNLHDGVQQQLVALGIDIGRAKARLDDDPDGARELLDQARDKVRGSIGELRLIGRGLHPAVLEDRGLDAALSAIVANSSIPINVEITTDVVLPDEVATTAYYVVNEAVTNIFKHASARVGSIRVDDDPGAAGAIRLTVHDDGRGGIDPSRGSGLAGIRARVEAMDGTFDVDSPVGGPTTLVIVLPLDVTSPIADASGGPG